ncbi:hypothetical protein CCACVL1_03929 [Corchorus capsularis]|uniref:Uncharacterized protein n=1 Tax=Corchorus capsularis TaxID=210143 RepID=A0A1R3JW92_COCAP|nr:hypothetical protein CCACVL1_03929 [Corchorus capsularis]
MAPGISGLISSRSSKDRNTSSRHESSVPSSSSSQFLS